MTLLVLSPDYASHYTPLATVAGAARDGGERVIVATGPAMRDRVEADHFEWCELRLGESSNTGTVARSPAIERFLAATRCGPIATLTLQAEDRARDLLWQPEEVIGHVRTLCDAIEPDLVLVDHVSFGSTLAMSATGRPFVSLVPGHPSQLPVGAERYGIPSSWPDDLEPPVEEVQALARLVDEVTERFTTHWNRALRTAAPTMSPVDDAFRVHGDRVLYNSVRSLADPRRLDELPEPHEFVGPLVRAEVLPAEYERWAHGDARRVYVAFGTFLAHRSDVIAGVIDALRHTGVRAAVAIGSTDPAELGEIPADWVVRPTLPQVALLRQADLAIHHGGNNSVQESLAAGVRQVVLPFSTDQFANAADLERSGAGAVLAPNDLDISQLAEVVDHRLNQPAPVRVPPLDRDPLTRALYSQGRPGRP
ncbi:MAG: glycosyltransferase [Ilumatobacteraceae bacterium]